jgi:hypothetical protein
VAELWHDDEMWAEVTYDENSKQFLIEMWGPQHDRGYRFALVDVVQALQGAERRLRELGYGQEP